VLQAGGDNPSIELLQASVRHTDGFACDNADLLLIQHGLIAQHVESYLSHLLLQRPEIRTLVLGVDAHDDFLSRLVRAGTDGGKRAEVAEILGISERTLYRKLEQYGLQTIGRNAQEPVRVICAQRGEWESEDSVSIV